MVVVETIRDVAITVALAVLIPVTLAFGLHAFLNETALNYYTLYFTISIIVGTLLIIGSFFVNISYLGAGILFGGAASIIVGVVHHWDRMHMQLQFFILLGAVAALIGLSYFFFMRGR